MIQFAAKRQGCIYMPPSAEGPPTQLLFLRQVLFSVVRWLGNLLRELLLLLA
jgi:hypothetical protein